MMDSSINPVQEPDKTKAPRHPHEEWELQKKNIERLYVVEERPLREVIQVLKQDHDFAASEKQIKSRLPKWSLDVKNLKGEAMVELARTKAKRAAVENKKSSFRVNKKPVDDRKIGRYLQRNDISEEQLLTMASPVDAPSPGFSVFTPQSARSSASPSPDFNFQTLSLVDTESSGVSDLLPTIAEEVTDSRDLQANSEHDVQTITSRTRASSHSHRNRHEHQHRHRSSSSVAWQTVIEEDAANRHDVSRDRFLDYKTRVYPSGYAGRGWDVRYEWLWSCDSCGEHGGMTTVIDHCPGCGHLRCSMCPLESIKVRVGR